MLVSILLFAGSLLAEPGEADDPATTLPTDLDDRVYHFCGRDSIDTDQLAKSEDFVPYETPPQIYADMPQPVAPADAEDLAAKVSVMVLIDEHGIVRSWRVLTAEPAGLGFEDAVGEAICQWRFHPALKQGMPVAIWIAIPFRFRPAKK
jgi:TonB family protein